jgi:hypothetical protein
LTTDSIRYLGFAVVATGREYQFQVAAEAKGGAERIFTLWIAADDFSPGRLKFQEGPDISLRKLKSLLASEPGGKPLALRHELGESDVTDYTATASSKRKTLTEEQRQMARDRYRHHLA